MIFFRVCLRGERERERERERAYRTYRWRKFRFQWLSQRSEERQESLEVQVRGAGGGKAHRSVSRRSRPSVSKVISQPRSLGCQHPVDRAAGAALRLIDLTHHVRVYSRATHDDFFSAFFDPIGRRLAFACFPFFFDYFD